MTNISVNVSVDIKIFCDQCGKELEYSGIRLIRTGIESPKNNMQIIIKPCKKCLDEISEKKYSEGYQDGHNTEIG